MVARAGELSYVCARYRHVWRVKLRGKRARNINVRRLDGDD